MRLLARLLIRTRHRAGCGRLAPQDYHRFHAPVDGVVGKIRPVAGTYYTVNPMAIRDRDIDVFTDNKRVVMTIRSQEFHRVRNLRTEGPRLERARARAHARRGATCTWGRWPS